MDYIAFLSLFMNQENQSDEHDLNKKDRRELRHEERTAREEVERNMRARAKLMKWLSVAIVLGFVVWGIVAANGPAEVVEPGEVVGSFTLHEGEWEKGNPEASVVLVEYSDLQCPACRQYYPMIQELAEALGTDVRVVYRHFPLRQVHTHAQLAAQASEAAGMQGKFWEMHDKLFDEQIRWSNMSTRGADDTFVSYAESLGLNVDQFKEDMRSRAAKDAVNEDYASGMAAAVKATPTFFLNGIRIANPNSYESLRATVQREIDLASARNTTVETESVK